MVFTNIFEGEEVREKVSRITDFSTALGSLLSMVCDGFGELQSDSVSQQLSIQGFVEKIQKHTEDIAGLHDYNEKQESNKDSHTNLMNELQQFILDFSTSSEQLRSEISNLRLTTKNELFATQGAMEKLFLEALEKMPAGGGAPTVSGGGVGKTIIVNAEDTGGRDAPAPTEYSQDDALQMLADRLFALEKKFTLSEVSNGQLRAQLDQQLQAQDKFDLLTTQLTQQDAQLQAQHDRGRIFEANLLKLKAGHIKTEKALKDINKKIDYLGSTVQKVIINGNITILAEEGDGEKAEDGEPIGFDFNFPDASSLGDEHSLTLETDSIMQEIKMNPTLSRNYLGAGGDPAAHDMIEALEQRMDDVFAPKILRLQDENGDLLGKLAEMSDSIRGLEETIKGLEDREEEAKARRREGRANFANDDEFYESLASLKTHWVNIFSDIELKLGNHAKELADEKEFSEADLKAIQDLSEFRNLLAENLHAFEAEDSVQATMDKLYPRLDSLNVEANRLFKTDRQISGVPGEEDMVEDGILDQIELSSGRGVSFLKSQSSSFKFPDDDAPVTADVGVGSGVVKSRGGSMQPSLSRVASEMIPEGENEEESVGEVAPLEVGPAVAEPVKPSEMIEVEPPAPALSRAASKRQSSSRMRLKSASSIDPGGAPLMRQPSALESFTHELANACLSSAPILGERIDKGVLKRRIDRIEDGLANFALLVDLNDEVEHFNEELTGKADKKDVKELKRKKANLSDLQTLRDQVFEQIEALRVAMDGAVMGEGSGDAGSSIGGGGRAVSGDITQRFDKLYNQFQDLVGHCAGFVHRAEVETALQSIVGELKQLKSVASDMDTLKRVVGKKAENWEVQRLISILSGGLSEPALGPAAIHQKCLSCDKPLVNPILQSLQQFGYATHLKNGGEESDDGRTPTGSRPNTTGGGSRQQLGNQHDIMSRSMNDAKALKSAINAGAPPGSAPNANGAEGLPPLSKSRSRAAAGGGMGPSYTFDTR